MRRAAFGVARKWCYNPPGGRSLWGEPPWPVRSPRLFFYMFPSTRRPRLPRAERLRRAPALLRCLLLIIVCALAAPPCLAQDEEAPPPPQPQRPRRALPPEPQGEPDE